MNLFIMRQGSILLWLAIFKWLLNNEENYCPQTDKFTRPFSGFIKRREAGIFPFYSGMFLLLLLINLYRVYKQILSNHLPTLP